MLHTLANKGQRWFFSGQGRSGLIVQLATMRFMHLGYDAHVVGAATAPAVWRCDGLLLVCGSGHTPVSLSVATMVKSEGAQLIVITHKPQTKLAGTPDDGGRTGCAGGDVAAAYQLAVSLSLIRYPAPAFLPSPARLNWSDKYKFVCGFDASNRH